MVYFRRKKSKKGQIEGIVLLLILLQLKAEKKNLLCGRKEEMQTC